MGALYLLEWLLFLFLCRGNLGVSCLLTRWVGTVRIISHGAFRSIIRICLPIGVTKDDIKCP